MKGPHFKEILETILISTKSNQMKIAIAVDVHYQSLSDWKRKGVPIQKVPLVMAKLREYLLTNIGGY